MKYFTIKELTKSAKAQANGIDNIPGKEEINNLTQLVDKVLDPLREMYGKPIRRNSAGNWKFWQRTIKPFWTGERRNGNA